ncbi:MAG: hypothetical protein NDI61_08195 [Bdellovibrionaceae bacterium]|nr:hypothetical protein [Pseudobdellovibrionaceae bacterium]
MRVSALTPQFVHETPEDPKGDAARALQPGLERQSRVLSKDENPEAQNTLQDARQDSLAEETKAGIRRLSQLIRERAEKKHGHSKQDSPRDQARRPPRAPESAPGDPQASPSGAPASGTNIVYIDYRNKVVGTYMYARDAAGVEETVGQLLDVAA